MLFCALGGNDQRKANKCKKLIEKLWRELKIQRSQRNSIIRQSSANIAQLLKAGQHDLAFARVDHLYKHMCMACAYHRVDQFSVQVYNNLHCISKNCELPTEVKKAMSSLVFASSVCEEFQELRLLKNLFRDRYGCEFVKTNVGLLPGNLVDEEVKGNLCIDSVADDVKLRLMSAIADEHLIEPRPWESSKQMIKASENMRRTRELGDSEPDCVCVDGCSTSSYGFDSSDCTTGSSSSSKGISEYQERSVETISIHGAEPEI